MLLVGLEVRQSGTRDYEPQACAELGSATILRSGAGTPSMMKGQPCSR
jgi:hypothetical protein